MMVISMWVNMKKMKNMVKEHLLMQMVISMWVNGKIMKEMVKEH
jgi:hypothetical protein